jgi:hypothetical protein
VAAALGQTAWERKKATGETWKQIADDLGKNRNTVAREGRAYARNIGAPGQRPGPQVRPPNEHIAPEFETPKPDDFTLEEFVDLIRQNQRAVNSVDPILTTETITLDANAPVGIIFVSCSHLGSRYVNHEAFVQLLNTVLDIPRLYWFALGDDVEGMTGFFDAASAHEQALADPKLQRRMLSLVLDKLAAKKKLLCGFAGQHGADWERRKRGTDPIKNMYLDRGVPYFDGQSFIRLQVGRQTYKLFAAHQLPGHSQYNKNHAQKRAALWKAPTADVVVMGDKHTYSVQQEAVDTFEYLAGERPSYLRWLVQVGSSKVGPDPYTIKTWSPAVWEWPVLIFRNDRHYIAQAPDLDLARYMLNGW